MGGRKPGAETKANCRIDTDTMTEPDPPVQALRASRSAAASAPGLVRYRVAWRLVDLR